MCGNGKKYDSICNEFCFSRILGSSVRSAIDGQIEDDSGRATKATKAAIALDFEDPC